MASCIECGSERQARYLTNGLCATCPKGKANTVINVPTSGFLTAGALNRLPQLKELGPKDSLSVIGDKRQRELMEDELRNFPRDLKNGDDLSESEKSKHEHPKKHQKTTGVQSFDIAPL
jgi:hypothetical protein